jgi:ubiquinone/menaquinone biosynthesis C-methylase UbiE
METAGERTKRLAQRVLFDRVAELYDATRRGYPNEVIDFIVTTAGVEREGAVLEVGCGTGQLTEPLARRGLDLTAIDIGPSMIATARRRLHGLAVKCRVISFEDFEAADESFDLIVSATAFHWIDPDVKFDKSARLLRPGGWLAVLATGERYDDPFGAALLDMWVKRSDHGGAWVKQAKLADTDIITATGLFDTPVGSAHIQRMVLPVETVIGVENTRATSLSWPDETRAEFISELTQALRSHREVSLTQETSVTMARRLASGTDPRRRPAPAVRGAGAQS